MGAFSLFGSLSARGQGLQRITVEVSPGSVDYAIFQAQTTVFEVHATPKDPNCKLSDPKIIPLSPATDPVRWRVAKNMPDEAVFRGTTTTKPNLTWTDVILKGTITCPGPGPGPSEYTIKAKGSCVVQIIDFDATQSRQSITVNYVVKGERDPAGGTLDISVMSLESDPLPVSTSVNAPPSPWTVTPSARCRGGIGSCINTRVRATANYTCPSPPGSRSIDTRDVNIRVVFS